MITCLRFLLMLSARQEVIPERESEFYSTKNNSLEFLSFFSFNRLFL